MAKTGNFNLDFPGANIICDSFQKRESILNFVNGKSNDIDVTLFSSDIEQDIQNGVYNTTYIHEGKHLHDHLVCPQLLHNYTLKLTALFYSILVINSWEQGDSKYKYIPLPFTSWIELPKDKQLKYIGDKGLSQDEIPVFSLRDAAHLLDGQSECKDGFIKSLLLGALHYSEYKYNTYQNSPDGYSTELSIRTFTESIAYVQQVTELALKYGDYGEKLHQNILNDSFQNFIEIGKRKRDKNMPITAKDYLGYSIYTSAFTMAWRYALQNSISQKYIYPFISHVLFWALSGNVIEGNKDANFPRNRIECLFNLDMMGIDLQLREESVILELFINPLETFHKWDILIGKAFANKNILITSQETFFTLKASTIPINYGKFYNKIICSLVSMVQHLISIGYNEPANYIYNIANSSYHMISLFLDNPSLYLYPEVYSRNIGKFVNVPYKIDFIGVDPIRLEECGSLRNGITIKDNSIWGNCFSSNQNNNMLTLNWELYYDAKKYIDFSNALLGESELNMPSRIIKKFLPGIKTWFFLE